MKTLRLGFVLIGGVACFVGPGCDDSRPIVDDPVGVGGEGNAGGEAPAAGGSDAPGVAGQGPGQGGATGTPECPADFIEADEQDCSAFGEGFACTGGGDD